jgi:hypothetical protein
MEELRTTILPAKIEFVDIGFGAKVDWAEMHYYGGAAREEGMGDADEEGGWREGRWGRGGNG